MQSKAAVNQAFFPGLSPDLPIHSEFPLSVSAIALKPGKFHPMWASTVPKLPLCHSSPECTMSCRQIKKEHLNQVAHCLSEYLERLLRSTDYETNLNLQYHDELCINVSRINRCSMKFFNSIVCKKVCKLTDPLHYHKRLSKKIDRACQLQSL